MVKGRVCAVGCQLRWSDLIMVGRQVLPLRASMSAVTDPNLVRRAATLGAEDGWSSWADAPDWAIGALRAGRHGSLPVPGD